MCWASIYTVLWTLVRPGIHKTQVQDNIYEPQKESLWVFIKDQEREQHWMTANYILSCRCSCPAWILMHSRKRERVGGRRPCWPLRAPVTTQATSPQQGGRCIIDLHKSHFPHLITATLTRSDRQHWPSCPWKLFQEYTAGIRMSIRSIRLCQD